jgi:hypothetical protein
MLQKEKIFGREELWERDGRMFELWMSWSRRI